MFMASASTCCRGNLSLEAERILSTLWKQIQAKLHRVNLSNTQQQCLLFYRTFDEYVETCRHAKIVAEQTI